MSELTAAASGENVNPLALSGAASGETVNPLLSAFLQNVEDASLQAPRQSRPKQPPIMQPPMEQVTNDVERVFDAHHKLTGQAMHAVSEHLMQLAQSIEAEKLDLHTALRASHETLCCSFTEVHEKISQLQAAQEAYEDRHNKQQQQLDMIKVEYRVLQGNRDGPLTEVPYPGQSQETAASVPEQPQCQQHGSLLHRLTRVEELLSSGCLPTTGTALQDWSEKEAETREALGSQVNGIADLVRGLQSTYPQLEQRVAEVCRCLCG